MSKNIRITLNDAIAINGELFDTPGGRALKDQLPFRANMDKWGEELYGPVSASVEGFEDDSIEVMDVGDLAFHQDTGWLCIFWGPTPASKGDEIRAAFPVHQIGKLEADWDELNQLSGRVTALVEEDQ